MVVNGSQINDIEKRFAHLLLPIRDLTKNWDVNIASELEEYLDEIEHIQISFDNGATVMNFAEAALVIQGSTSVYSRKVEYLYSLTYQVLGLIASKRKLKNAALPDGNADNDVVTADEREEEFLSLDDTKEHKNIDIKNDGQNLNKTVCAIPITPMSLIPLTEEEKGENPLFSKRREIVASRRDFRLNTSTPHHSGLMLLEMTQSNLIHCSFMTAATSTPFVQPPLTHDCVDQGEIDIHNDGPCDNDEGHHSLSSVDGPDNVSSDGHITNDVNAPQVDGSVVARHSERERRLPPPFVAHSVPQAIQPVDPHVLHDPHSAGQLVQKPFCKGKPFRLPASLRRGGKRKKQLVSAHPTQPPISETICQLFDGNWTKLPRNPLKIPAYPELEEMFWEEHKRRQEVYKKHRDRVKMMARHEELMEEPEMLEEGEEEEEGGLFNDPGIYEDAMEADSDPQTVNIHATDIHRSHDPSPTDDSPLHRDLLATSIEADVVSTFEDLVRQHIEGFLINAQLYTNRTDLEKRVAQWEERIVPILEDEETHGTFDIHKYGSWVIERLTPGHTTEFQSIVAGQRTFEICRLFLATLQLANNYNVEIGDAADDAVTAAMDSVRLTLLSSALRRVNLAET